MRTIIPILTFESWQLHRLDVKNTFLHGDLEEEVYTKLLNGSIPTLPNIACDIKRSLYRLKQTLRIWFGSSQDLSITWLP